MWDFSKAFNVLLSIVNVWASDIYLGFPKFAWSQIPWVLRTPCYPFLTFTFCSEFVGNSVEEEEDVGCYFICSGLSFLICKKEELDWIPSGLCFCANILPLRLGGVCALPISTPTLTPICIQVTPPPIREIGRKLQTRLIKVYGSHRYANAFC